MRRRGSELESLSAGERGGRVGGRWLRWGISVGPESSLEFSAGLEKIFKIVKFYLIFYRVISKNKK